MKSRTGTLEWARRTGGTLSFSDHLRQLTQAMTLQFTAASARWLRSLGLRRGAPAPVNLRDLRAPDSAAAREAEALCTEASPPFLVNHCLRSYAWGTLLAARDRIRYDSELLYVACLLHDLGVTERFWGPAPGVHCFAVEGALEALRFAERVGWNEERGRIVAEAICLHLNVRVGLEHGPEAHLLQAGSALDVVGARYRQIARDAVQAMIERHPRLGFKKGVDRLLRAQAEARPKSRAHVLYDSLNFGRWIAEAPFSE